MPDLLLDISDYARVARGAVPRNSFFDWQIKTDSTFESQMCLQNQNIFSARSASFGPDWDRRGFLSRQLWRLCLRWLCLAPAISSLR